MIPVRRLAHLTFETADLQHHVAHYTEVVGLNVVAQERDTAVLATVFGEEVLVLKRGKAERCLAMALQVDPAFDLDAVRRELQRRGLRGESRSGITPGIKEALAFQAPNDVTIELFRESELSLGKNGGSGVQPIKLGHIAFMVPDPKAMVDFYTDLLGFRVSDWAGDYFAFLRCGPDHHTVNFLAGAAPRMHHFAFELRDWAHVQGACELLGQREIPIIWGPGRHGIGHNIFLYHFNPGRQVIEFYTEMDQMKDESLGYFEPRPWHKDRPQRPKVWPPGSGAICWGLPPSTEYQLTHGPAGTWQG